MNTHHVINFLHKFVGVATITSSTVAIGTGITNKLSFGVCYLPTTSSDPNPTAHHTDSRLTCKIAYTTGFFVMIASIGAIFVVFGGISKSAVFVLPGNNDVISESEIKSYD